MAISTLPTDTGAPAIDETDLEEAATEAEIHFHRVDASDAGERADKLLARVWSPISRARLTALAAQGHLRLNGATINEGKSRVKPGQLFELTVPPPVAADPEPENIPLAIRFEDEHLLVIAKPAGMVVHPAVGNATGTLVNALLYHCGDRRSGIGGVKRPGIVHRLDKDTSGLMVVAKTDLAHQALATQFAEEKEHLERLYQAIVWGQPIPSSGEITGNIGRDSKDRKRMTVLKRGGKEALTRYEVQRSRKDGAASLVHCRLATGRTHQIRVHMNHIGHSLVGDPVYSGRRKINCLKQLPERTRQSIVSFDRQALHAATLGFRHPVQGEIMTFREPLPEDLTGVLASLEI